jgi:hypothetical protein
VPWKNNLNEAKPQTDEANPESKAVSHEGTKKDDKQFTVFLFFVGFVASCENCSGWIQKFDLKLMILVCKVR